MGLKSTFEEYSKKNPNQIIDVLKESKTFLWASNLSLSEKETLVLSSLSLIFLKMIVIDRDIDETEVKEVKKRITRFIKIEEPGLSALLNASKNDITNRESGIGFVSSASYYLSSKANDKTKNRIFRYLINIIAADKKIETEESYLLELIGGAFEISEKTVREYLLAAELQTSLEELEKVDHSKDPFSSPAGDGSPVIKFELS